MRHFVISICIHTPNFKFLPQCALDKKQDNRTDRRTDGRMEGWTVRLLYASKSSFGGIKTVLLTNLSSWLPQTQCVYTVHHCIKPESPSDGQRYVILASKLMLRCSLKFNPQSVIRYQEFALRVKRSIRENCLSSHSCHFVKKYFSEPNSFMHMFNLQSTLYRKSIKLLHQKLW